MIEKKIASVLKKLKRENSIQVMFIKWFKKQPFFLLTLFFIIVLIVSAYFFIKYLNTRKLLQNPAVKAAQELEKIVSQIDKFMELPTDEIPTMYTVADKSKLPNQNFYEKAENGDKLLIYNKVKKAILYRPSINKIIEIGPVSTSPITATSSGSTNGQLFPSPTITLNPTISL